MKAHLFLIILAAVLQTRALSLPARANQPSLLERGRLASSPICQSPHFATAKCVTPHRAASPPHIILASSLVRIIVRLITRLSSGSPSTPLTRGSSHREREIEPCFIGSALCERVHDVEAGHTFYLCEAPADATGYVSRKVGRGGRWIYYTTCSHTACS
eukprot:scaffold159366_cov35-Tisochrysis_lutea.AAC.1